MLVETFWKQVATAEGINQSNKNIVYLIILTWKTSSSSRRAPNTVMPLVSISALLPRGSGRVIFFLQSSSRVTFFFETDKAMRCHLQTRRRNHRQKKGCYVTTAQDEKIPKIISKYMHTNIIPNHPHDPNHIISTSHKLVVAGY